MIIASLRLTKRGWLNFEEYFRAYPRGIVSQQFISKQTWTRQFTNEKSGHAVAIVDYDENTRSFKAINSWGQEFGENGYFRIEEGLFLRFYDVYGTGIED